MKNASRIFIRFQTGTKSTTRDIFRATWNPRICIKVNCNPVEFLLGPWPMHCRFFLFIDQELCLALRSGLSLFKIGLWNNSVGFVFKLKCILKSAADRMPSHTIYTNPFYYCVILLFASPPSQSSTSSKAARRSYIQVKAIITVKEDSSRVEHTFRLMMLLKVTGSPFGFCL